MTFPTDLRHFGPGEFKYPDRMDVACLRWWDRVRQRSGVPMVITSDARPSDGDSLHHRGRAIDIRTRDLSVGQKWKLAAAIFALADEAPGKVEFEPVFSATDRHWHIGIDPRPGAVHEMVEADE